MKKVSLIIGALAAGVAVHASPVTFNFAENGSNTSLGSSSIFTEGGVQVEAWALPAGQDLYAKQSVSGENGLGIASDPSGDHEIWGTTYIQLAALTSGFVLDSIFLNSVQAGEIGSVYWSPTQGVVGTLIGSVTADGSINLDAYSKGYFTIGVDLASTARSDVLIRTVTGHTTVPDGASTLLLLGTVLTGIGITKRALAV